ncbi:MAG: DUF1538 domain-containing protein [Gammaproteobacteria bacterium]|nr:DUF1538 domain-containing protein [Gammaproteobacteria bacterium]
MQAALYQIRTAAQALLRSLGSSLWDLLPLVVVVAVFQILVIQKPLPNLGQVAMGAGLVLVGLTLLMRGLELAFFPVGERLAIAFARRGSLAWLLIFGYALGFATTVAEPALIAVAGKAADIAVQGGFCPPEHAELYANTLRYTVAMSAALALVIGVFRIVFGWNLVWIIATGYMLVVILTPLAPAEIVGIAYDSGGVTTSTITVPLVTALGVGLASSIEGRHPVTDGFGLIALAALFPIIGVLTFGLIWVAV